MTELCLNGQQDAVNLSKKITEYESPDEKPVCLRLVEKQSTLNLPDPTITKLDLSSCQQNIYNQ